ncbi:MAG: hypothetical protein Q7S95_03500 [bacterium]|nr:hypothetical protein [bacterium]
MLLVGAGAAAVSFLTSSPPVTHGNFGNPELVTIQGYIGPVQDPWITSDDKYILWEDRTDIPGSKSYVYYAKKIDYKTFSLVGKVQGLQSVPAAAPTTDNAGNIYFLTDLYASQNMTIGHGTFADGVVTNMAPTLGLSQGGNVNGPYSIMSAAPSRDGKLLVFSDTGGTSILAIAERNADGTFTRLTNSAYLLDKVNNDSRFKSVLYSGSLSSDGLELFFVATKPLTQSRMNNSIYVARRTSITEPFAVAQGINTGGNGLSEGPSLSLDGKHLYFHKVISTSHTDLYVLSRE